VGQDMGRMVVRAPEVVRAARPGQFFMILCWEGEPLLPRAMAPLSYNVSAGSMDIFYRIMGPGTEAMARAPVGVVAHVTGPLGRPVTERYDGRKIALVGRMNAYLFGLDEFWTLGPVRAIADDEGFADEVVTSLLEEACETEGVDAAYVCGSRRLIRHTTEIGERYGFPAFAFLEEKMGCGIGYCKGCPIELRNGGGYRLVCTDGPLFLTREVVLP